MKIVLYLLIIAAAGWAGWISQPGLHHWMKDRVETRKAAKERDVASAVNKSKQEDRADGGDSFNSKVLDALINRPGGNPAMPAPGTGTTSTTPGIVASNTPPTDAPAPTLDEIEARYPMPTFKTIEEITKEWSAVPSRAFPRKVKTKVPLTFDSAAGKVELPTGADAKAAGMVAGMLIVMREEDASTRIQVPLANTDLKETMTALYDKYKEYRRNMVIKQREHARELKNRSNGATEDQMTKAGPKPEVRAGGVIPIMLDDVLTGKYTELKAAAITSWGKLDFEQIDGTVYWTGTVQVTVDNPLFGPQPTEIMALMKDNKVVKWIYTGSREPVQ